MFPMKTKRPAKKTVSVITLALRPVYARKDFALLSDIDGTVYCTTAGHLFGAETAWNGSRAGGLGSVRGGFHTSRRDVFLVRAEFGSVTLHEGQPRQWLNRVQVIEQAEVVDTYPDEYARVVDDAAGKIDRFMRPEARFQSETHREAACKRAARSVDIWAVQAFTMFLAAFATEPCV